MTGDIGPAWQRHRAARTVAGNAHDAEDLAELLSMLGLTAAEGRQPPAASPPEPPRKPVPRLDPPTECRLSNLLRAAQRRGTGVL
jgi:hypothetical protein